MGNHPDLGTTESTVLTLDRNSSKCKTQMDSTLKTKAKSQQKTVNKQHLLGTQVYKDKFFLRTSHQTKVQRINRILVWNSFKTSQLCKIRCEITSVWFNLIRTNQIWCRINTPKWIIFWTMRRTWTCQIKWWLDKMVSIHKSNKWYQIQVLAHTTPQVDRIWLRCPEMPIELKTLHLHKHSQMLTMAQVDLDHNLVISATISDLFIVIMTSK